MIYCFSRDISFYDTSKKGIEGDWLKKTEQLTDSMFFIMAGLTKPKHGYAIMNLIEETTKGAITIGPASMYTIIKKLLKKSGFICMMGRIQDVKHICLLKRVEKC